MTMDEAKKALLDRARVIYTDRDGEHDCYVLTAIVTGAKYGVYQFSLELTEVYTEPEYLEVKAKRLMRTGLESVRLRK